MKYLVVIPSIYKEYTDRCLATLDPLVQRNTMVIDNTVTNIGIPKSWNQGAISVVGNEYDWLIIVSAAMRFFTGGLSDLIATLAKNPDAYGVETQHGWHCIALNKKLFDEIGYFDENFYPGYYEDSDFIRRMELAGIHNPVTGKPRLPKVEIGASCTTTAHGIKKAGVEVDFEKLGKYFKLKWGALPEYETQAQRDRMHKHPFDNPNYPLSYWPKKKLKVGGFEIS